MSDIITTKTRVYTNPDNNEEIISTSTHISRLVGGTLFIYSLRKDEEDKDVEVLVMEQPWKCNPDGSRSPWQDEQDAENWLEANKQNMLPS
jgi:hypothetical protein